MNSNLYESESSSNLLIKALVILELLVGKKCIIFHNIYLYCRKLLVQETFQLTPNVKAAKLSFERKQLQHFLKPY